MKLKNLITILIVGGFGLMLSSGISYAQSQEDNKAENSNTGHVVSENEYELMDMGKQNVGGWQVIAVRYRGVHKGKGYDEAELSVTPLKASDDKISAIRGWLGDQDSDSLRHKLHGHSHGGPELHYGMSVKPEEGDDTTQFSAEIETEKGKSFLVTFKFTTWKKMKN